MLDVCRVRLSTSCKCTGRLTPHRAHDCTSTSVGLDGRFESSSVMTVLFFALTCRAKYFSFDSTARAADPTRRDASDLHGENSRHSLHDSANDTRPVGSVLRAK
jgi:hypothetical protein